MWVSKYKRTTAAATLSAILIVATTTYYLVFPPPKVPKLIFRYTETITIENRGNSSIELGRIATEGFPNLEWQRASLEEVNGSYTISRDGDGNPIVVVDPRPLRAESPSRSP